MFEKRKLQDILWMHYSDADIMREKPMVFRHDPYCIVCDAVKYIDHPLFVQMMGYLLTKHAWVFDQVGMLTDKNFRDKEAIEAMVAGLTLMKVGDEYTTFISDAEDFILRWALIFKRHAQGHLVEVADRQECLESLRSYKIDELYHMLFTLIVYNFHLVKKNLGVCLATLLGSATTGTSGQVSKKPGLPTFDLSRYKRSPSSSKGARS